MAVAVIATLAIPGAESAFAETVLNLTTVGSSGAINGAIFAQTEQQPTGTGFIDSFSRLQANSLEEGFNTNGTPPYDEKAGSFTHAIQLSSLAPVTNVPGQGSTPFYEFLLDINQTSSNNLLNLNRLQIWGAASPTLGASAYNFGANGSFDSTGNTNGSTGTLAGGTKVYDIDTGTDNGVLLNYSLNSGSGSGDMFLYVPVAAFNIPNISPTSFLYLYSAFGNPNASNDGFEEWAAHTGSAGVPFNAPAPSTLGLTLSAGIAFALVGLYRFRRQVTAPLGAGA